MTLAGSYRTAGAEPWDASTNAQRIGRWFLPVGGTRVPGGRYRFEDNANGVITACVLDETRSPLRRTGKPMVSRAARFDFAT